MTPGVFGASCKIKPCDFMFVFSPGVVPEVSREQWRAHATHLHLPLRRSGDQRKTRWWSEKSEHNQAQPTDHRWAYFGQSLCLSSWWWALPRPSLRWFRSYSGQRWYHHHRFPWDSSKNPSAANSHSSDGFHPHLTIDQRDQADSLDSRLRIPMLCLFIHIYIYIIYFVPSKSLKTTMKRKSYWLIHPHLLLSKADQKGPGPHGNSTGDCMAKPPIPSKRSHRSQRPKHPDVKLRVRKTRSSLSETRLSKLIQLPCRLHAVNSSFRPWVPCSRWHFPPWEPAAVSLGPSSRTHPSPSLDDHAWMPSDG